MTTISVIGATGGTGRPLTEMLRADGVDVRAASRSGEVRFDWYDPATHEAVLTGADAVYLVAPLADLNPMPTVGPFLDRAREVGLKRLVLLGSLAVLPDTPTELADTVRAEPGWTVLRPSAFMRNLLGAHPVATRLRERDELLSASGDGKLGWIDTEDIAAVARVLLRAEQVEDEYALTGPEALGFHDLARILRERTGRPVEVAEVGVEELAAIFRATGMPADYADRLARYNGAIREESETVTDTVAVTTGRPPRSFGTFAELHMV
ncbi:uncharacterized protein YbjT (DUF2867 family) [Crossiella equi]|uniref:Uncharacterized protein YbjT (DUF2867 family) n=1 Tax=Crossiella equi TaxID=130796 RepID=A0ABS5A8C4_9PSEU|nr:NAD(P)H-binding protein [Crossiella equi]MBP2472479.1 uncharacterized protein YbjT (DUF2867 family) [Crossiella equi]